MPSTLKEIQRVMNDWPTARASLEAAMAKLRKEPYVREGRMAALGYCFGGGVVMKGEFSLVDFYDRRIRRIFPALFVVLPLIGPSIVGIGMFGLTLSWDEIARTSQAIGDVNTLPLELQGLTSTVTTPSIYALGTVTTVVSLLVMAAALGAAALLRRRSTRRG